MMKAKTYRDWRKKCKVNNGEQRQKKKREQK